MVDPDNLPDALHIIEDINQDRQALTDLLNGALSAEDPDQKRGNKVAFGHGEVRRLGRDYEELLQWVVDNVPANLLTPRLGQMVSLLAKWKDSPFTKFDDDLPISPPPPGGGGGP